MDAGESRRAERKERRDRERRRKGAEQSDQAFGGDDVAVAEAFAAARRDDVPEMERLFHLGVDPRVVSKADGHTLLHAACGRGAARVAKLVVRRAVYDHNPPKKKFLDARGRDGTTSLDVARAAGFERIAEWLEALGAKSGFSFGGDRTGVGAYALRTPYDHPNASGYAGPLAAPTAGHVYPGGPSFYPPPLYGGAADPARGGWAPAPNHAPTQTDAYLLGALESVLGELNDDETNISDARFGADGSGGFGAASLDDRARGRRLVRRVSELVEDLDDYKGDLEACFDRCAKAEKRVAQLERALKIAEGDLNGALKAAQKNVAKQRAEEQKAVLDALGLAEQRAVRMAAERETLREERDAIAEALAFVKDQTRALFLKTNETEADTQGEGDRPGGGSGSVAEPSPGSSGIEPRGGGLHEVEIPKRGAEDAVDDAAETLQMLEVPLGD